MTHELRHALADLVDQRYGGIPGELEHRCLVGAAARYLTIMTAVVASARAMVPLNTRRPRGAAMKLLSELPNSAHTAMHGVPIPSATTTM